VSLRRKKRSRTGRTATAALANHSRFARIIVAISLALQLVFAPTHNASAAATQPSHAAIVADFKAIFGDATALCAHSDDRNGPASPSGDCGDHCLFCRFAAQDFALIIPQDPGPPAPLAGLVDAVVGAREATAVRVQPTRHNRARAPPSAV
jgi:hypothetical protein